MTDRELREKVINGLDHCVARDTKPDTHCNGCPYIEDESCRVFLKIDARKVLKWTTTPDIEDGGAFRFFVCGECRTSIRDNDNYCRECGRRVVWG